MRIVVNEDTLLFSPYELPSRPYAFFMEALHTGRNLTDDLVTMTTLQLHMILLSRISRRRCREDIPEGIQRLPLCCISFKLRIYLLNLIIFILR